MDIFGSLNRFAGSALGINLNSSQKLQPSPEVPLPDITSRPNIPPNIERLHDAFTTTDMRDRSDGTIHLMTRQGASALAGNYAVETGKPDLTGLDVVEKGAKAGRGLAQYTASRRGPYDKARQDYIDQGGDPNDLEFQLDYAANEYAGAYDPAPGRSLISWTKSLSGETDGMSVPEAATHLRKDFFRPSIPHNQRRIDNALNIDSMISQRDQRISDLSSQTGFKNSSLAHVGHRGVDGRYWAGDDYGWQSPESYKALIGY